MAIKTQEPTLFLRVDKKNKKDSRMPIYIRFQRIDDKEPKFPLGISCLPEKWDKVKKCILDSDGLDIRLQNEMTRIRKEVRNAEMNEVEITVDLLREIVSEKGKKANNPENQSFYYYFEEYVSKKRKIGYMKESTVKTYDTTLRSLKEFRPEIRIKDINAKLLGDFDKFLIKRAKDNNNGDVKGSRRNRIKHIRAIIRYIDDLKIPIKNPYKTHDLRIPEDVVNNVFIDIDELRRMYKLINNIEEKSIEFRVLLMYLFSCATGIRIGDALALKWGNINVDFDPWILCFNTIKTGKSSNIPIFPLASEMLQYIPENDLGNIEPEKPIFHYYCPDEVNKALRRLAEMADIDKHLTYHSSRRTFATLAIVQGALLQDLKNYMGHSSIRTTERYMKWGSKMAEYTANKVNLFELKELLKKI